VAIPPDAELGLKMQEKMQTILAAR